MPRSAQEDAAPQLLFTALQLADHVRYAVTLLRPLSATVTNVRVDVLLPAGTELAETLQTQGRSLFLGSNSNTLSWAAPSYEPGDPVDAFTFRVSRPLGGAAQVRVSWEVDGQPRRDEILAAPDIEIASAAAGDVILRTSIETGPIGDTGVRVEFDPESGLEGVELRLRKPGPEANPPAGVGSPWWCAALAVAGLPAGAGVFVVVPLRQPLPPGARVDLFAERGGEWEPLTHQGHATADGQFVAFRHPGGTVAAGVSTILQPIASQPVLELEQLTPKLQLRLFGPTSISAGHGVLVSEVGGAPAERVRVDFIVTGTINLSGLSGEGVTCEIRTSQRGRCEIPSLAAGTGRIIRFGVSNAAGRPCPNAGSGTVRISAANNTNPNAPDTPTTRDIESAFIKICR
jgi:hypothetical protein